ncbi:hypothetical protein [Streptomyces sp. NPDC001820]|uniref:hypothetical protein n=1 Tax=Streptomyces sp. NPDC001820 TaxID=3364613 RepID=UPI0036B61C1B
MLGGPGGDWVWDGVALAAAVSEEFAVGIPPDPGDAIAERGQQAQYLGRLRAGCDVAGEYDAVRSAYLWFVEHRLQGGQDSVNVRQDGYLVQHGHYCGMTPALKWNRSLLAKREMFRSIAARISGFRSETQRRAIR